MLSTQIQQAIIGFDEVIREQDDDFSSSGLHATSAVRIARLAVVGADLLEGAIGEIGPARLDANPAESVGVAGRASLNLWGQR